MKKLLYIFIICILAGLGICHAESDETENSFAYQSNDDGTVSVTGWTGSKDILQIIIPERIDGQLVTRVTSDFFFSCDNTLVEKITIPASVTEFCDYPNTSTPFVIPKTLKMIEVAKNNSVFASFEGALYTNGLRKLLYVPKAYDGVLTLHERTQEISYGAMYGCSYISEIVLPKDITGIQGAEFRECVSLEKFTVSKENVNYFSYEGLLYQYHYLTYNIKLISVPAKKAKGAFEIPDMTGGIAYYAFENCSEMTKVYIPADVRQEEISKTFDGIVTFDYSGENWFLKCTALKEIVVDDKNQYLTSSDGVLYSKDMTVLYSYPRAKENDSFQIAEGVEEIGTNAFAECINLKNITFSENVQRIGIKAFEFCIALEEIVIPTGLQQIDTYAFSTCKGLTKVTLPETIKIVYDNAFFGCIKLETINAGKYTESIMQSVETISTWKCPDESVSEPMPAILAKALQEQERISGILTYRLTEDSELVITGLTEEAKSDKRNRSIVIPDYIEKMQVVAIAEGAFAFLPITEVTLPEGLREIGKGAFYGCNINGNVDIPTTVNYIAPRAFGANYGLRTIKVADKNKVYTSQNGVLYDKALTMLVQVPAYYDVESFEVLDSILIIGEYAFGNSKYIKKVEIPDSVIEIREKAFWGTTISESE